MKETPLMIYKKVLENRLARKKEELTEIEGMIDGGGLQQQSKSVNLLN